MAQFKYETIKLGYVDKNQTTVLSLKEIVVEEDDEIIVIPEEFEGIAVTYIGYKQGKNEAYFKYHDWHHPAQGGDYIPEEYVALECDFLAKTSNLKKVIFPSAAKYINFSRINYFAKDVVFEISPDNKYYKVTKDGKIYYK